MTRPLRIAAVQMDAEVAPTAERLERAEALVSAAAADGAELVALPEIFNTGYTYDASLVRRAERLDGPTSAWMRGAAARFDVHLAGSFLLVEGGEVYNALLLYAPDGSRWRYDKVYPWAWERSAFRGSRASTVVADTALGKIGLLVCWDTSHLPLWARYAGAVDLMVITSCPVDVTHPTYHLPDGRTLGFDDLGPVAALSGSEDELFGAMLDEQVAWLGVPAVNTVGCGRVRTPLPRSAPLAAVLGPLVKRSWPPRFVDVEMECGGVEGCKVLDPLGRSVAARGLAQGEGLAIGDVSVGSVPRRPDRDQPPTRLQAGAYFISDRLIPRLVEPVYRRNVRAAWGGARAAS